MRTRWMASAMSLVLLPPATVFAQDPHHMADMQRVQEHMHRMQESMQTMHELQRRAMEMERWMVGELERIREQAMLQEQDHLRIREQEQIRDMAHAISTAAREMAQAMERARDMMGDPMGPAAPEMGRQMERLREQMDVMVGAMEASLAILEEIRPDPGR